MRGVFVTGTDTDVGKTVVSAALMSAFSRAHYWKPVQSGTNLDDDTRRVTELSGASEGRFFTSGIRLELPASPHFAAAAEGREILLEDILSHAPRGPEPTVVEGAGGLMVPLSPTLLLPDLIAALALPVLIVASTKLGTINHSLLTERVLRDLGIPVIGFVLSGDPDPSACSGITDHAQAPIVAQLPWVDECSLAQVQEFGRQLGRCHALRHIFSQKESP